MDITTCGLDLPKRLSYKLSMNCGSGAFHGSCL
jgi:hypothetical protein